MFRIYKYLTKNWIVDALLSTIPAAVFVIIQVAGKQLGLYDDNDNLKTWVLVCFWTSLTFSVVYNFIKIWFGSHYFKRNELFQNIISCTNSICNSKGNNMIECIRKGPKIVNVFWTLVDSKGIIQDLLKEINVCLSSVTGIKRDSIGLSIIYKYDFESEWNYNGKLNISGTPASKIMGNGISTARKVIDGKIPYIFLADKKLAIEKLEYVPSTSDNRTGLKGSIICYNLSTDDDLNIKYIQAVLSVTTYEELLCEESDKEKKKIIIDEIIKPFSIRLKNELYADYIREKVKLQGGQAETAQVV